MDLLNLMVKIGAEDHATSVIKGVAAGVGKVAKIGAAAVGAATTAVGGFAASAIGAGMNFDAAMSQVAATMGTTVDQIGELRDFAQEMGATTMFSASQAAEALNYMALAGYDAETSMEMLPTVLDLAAAGGMDLADASDMVTDAASALGLSIDDTKTLIDEMAVASSKTNTSVSQLGSAILTVGGTAKDLSGGTVELTQALGILADNGIKGAEGGTALRNILLALETPTDQAAKKMQELGLQVFDAEGKMRPLPDIMQDMNGALGNLSQEERTQALAEIFNAVDLKSANALLATSAERWDEVAAAISDADGAASAMAATQMDNLAGDITSFQSALEGVQIAISDQLTPTLREFVQLGTGGLQDITAALKSGDLDGAFEVVGDILSQLVVKVTELLPRLVELGGKLISGFVNAIAQNATAIGLAGADIARSLVTVITEALPDIIDAAANIAVAFMSGMTQNMPSIVESIDLMLTRIVARIPVAIPRLVGAAVELMQGLVDGIVQAWPLVMEAVVTVAQTIASMMPQLTPQIVEMITQLVLVFVENAPLMLEAAIALIQGITQGLIAAMPALIEGMVQVINAIIDVLPTMIPMLIEASIQLFMAIVQALPEILSALLAGLGEIIGHAGETIGGAAGEMLTAAGEWFAGLVEGAAQKGTELLEWVAGIPGNILSALGDLGGLLLDAGSQILGGFLEGLKSAWDGVTEFVGGIGTWIAEHKGPEQYDRTLLVHAGQLIMGGLASGIEDGMDEVRAAIGDVNGLMSGGFKFRSVARPALAAAGAGAVGGVTNIYIDSDLIASDERLRSSFGAFLDELAVLGRL